MYFIPVGVIVRKNIKIGEAVMVVQKQDQRSGKLTEGVVQRILTNSQNHPRGIKVMLEGGIVGRVQDIVERDK
ncbi:YwbE family protein [uncultured Robinsoniella sp.]|uniref:YwbE family protein n=1 Tax=uncultured Robinsoniella sp. TaxID=904190 RepID=UPI00374E5D23